jgi:hypothetical protein
MAAALAAPKPREKESSRVIDAGTFNVMVNGKKVGNETFKIEQRGNNSFTTSQVKVTEGDKAEQTAELEMTSAGELVHYAWREVSPGKAQSTVDVTSGSLLQRIVMNNGKKPVELPHMAPATTFILDDNFFTHRELLTWRYIASCTVSGDTRSCPPMKLGVLIPAQHIMAVVNLEMIGSEKIMVNGAERDLTHIKLTTDDVEWGIWVDPADSFKIIRITIPANKTEVVRE